LNQPVSERRFAVVDVGDDGKIADIFEFMGGHGAGIAARAPKGKGVCRLNDIGLISSLFLFHSALQFLLGARE
jgi:hypothetical protein